MHTTIVHLSHATYGPLCVCGHVQTDHKGALRLDSCTLCECPELRIRILQDTTREEG